MKKYYLGSDCCGAKTKRVWNWCICLKCNKRCVLERLRFLSTDITREVVDLHSKKK